MNVATTILQQMGGQRLIAMTGAHSFVSDGDSLIFKVPARSTKNGISCVKVTLDPSDTYTMRFLTMKNYQVQTVAERSDVYCDQLQEVFQEETGLFTSLGWN
jgi:hypothetical protein